MERACRNCIHFASLPNETLVGICRFRPPVYDFDLEPEGVPDASKAEAYGMVCLDDVCGQFTAVDAPPKKDEISELKLQIGELESGQQSLNMIIDGQREEIRTLEKINEILKRNSARLTATLNSTSGHPFQDVWKPAEITVTDPMEDE